MAGSVFHSAQFGSTLCLIWLVAEMVCGHNECTLSRRSCPGNISAWLRSAWSAVMMSDSLAAYLKTVLRYLIVKPSSGDWMCVATVMSCQYKLALMMFLVHSHRCPDYMSNTVSLLSDDPGRQRLRSATSTDYHVPCARTKLGDREFSIAGPKAWNNLPQSVRSADNLDSFKRKLKFYLFNSYFNVWTVYVCVLL